MAWFWRAAIMIGMFFDQGARTAAANSGLFRGVFRLVVIAAAGIAVEHVWVSEVWPTVMKWR